MVFKNLQKHAFLKIQAHWWGIKRYIDPNRYNIYKPHRSVGWFQYFCWSSENSVWCCSQLDDARFLSFLEVYVFFSATIWWIFSTFVGINISPVVSLIWNKLVKNSRKHCLFAYLNGSATLIFDDIVYSTIYSM